MTRNYTPSLESNLAPYAVTVKKSLGRIDKNEKHHEDDYRTEFQHDRDRILHSKSFRRLDSKTQVILAHESDHSRNRLTHSLEVAQISESIAIGLGLNYFATNAIALGHDLGHTPFGHGGERALHSILCNFNMSGFKHNYQSILVVNKLEKRYNKNCGLNLMLETRDGILKHTKLKNDQIDIEYYDKSLNPSTDFPLTLEGQIVNNVDEIAQRSHDTDDGLRTGRIKIRDLLKQQIVKESLKKNNLDPSHIENTFGNNRKIVISALIIALIKYYVNETLNCAVKGINKHKIKKYEDLQKKDVPVINWGKRFKERDKKFQEGFLWTKFYQNYEVQRMDSRASYFIEQIFKAFKNHPKQMPETTFKEYIKCSKDSMINEIKTTKDREYKSELKTLLNNELKCCKETCDYLPNSKEYTRIESTCPFSKRRKPACEGIRVIINHLAGMTDRYAHLEYSRLYFPPGIMG